jgi:nucleoside-diphosphate-sugar epimerase
MAKIFLAGATGVIGDRLLPMLIAAGHQVTGTTRSEEKAARLRESGADAVVVDLTDVSSLTSAVAAAKPEVVINQLTALPKELDYRDKDYLDATNVLRREVSPVLASAAADAGATRLIVQSIAFIYAPEGPEVLSEEAPLLSPHGPKPYGPGSAAVREAERSALETPGVEGVVLRYGWFYGPGTYYASDGSNAREARRRRLPVIKPGTGRFSFIHVDDAASATVAAVERGSGIYNVVDDDPAEMREWVPAYAEALGAKPPFGIPAWVARIAAGKDAIAMANNLRGASNAKGKQELGWEPRFPSWRQGFREALG